MSVKCQQQMKHVFRPLPGQAPRNGRRPDAAPVNIRPKEGEDHFSVITAHDRELRSYLLGGAWKRIGSEAVTMKSVPKHHTARGII